MVPVEESIGRAAHLKEGGRRMDSPLTTDRQLRYALKLPEKEERDLIYQLRHEVYSEEIGQHPPHELGRLQDSLDAENLYITAWCEDALAGFICLTPPKASHFSLDKYFPRDALPFAVDERTFEVRLLTVRRKHRGGCLFALLMHAALRWVEAHGGTRIIGIGRDEALPMYRRSGLKTTGLRTLSGQVTYELMFADTGSLRHAAATRANLIKRAGAATDWQLPMPFQKPAPCFHGGAFFDAVGSDFKSLDRAGRIINADVLDAWFDPAPAVIDTLKTHLPWLLRTSPPTACEGLASAIAASRGIAPENVLVGGGSSDLIFRALPRWLDRKSRVLLLDPAYGEYAHVLEQVIGCRVERLHLHHIDRYRVRPAALLQALETRPDWVVLVNPNSPTGVHLPAEDLAGMLQAAPKTTRFWIDETYIDYVGPGQSLEQFAASSLRVVVCKSMSKAYALSGARAAYLCAAAPVLEPLRAVTPPWVVGLPSQAAAVRALESHDYYSAKWRETDALRQKLGDSLRLLGWDVVVGTANFLLCHAPSEGPCSHEWVRQCRERDLFLRDASPMGRTLGRHAIRVAVKDALTCGRMLKILSEVDQKFRATKI